MIWTNLKNKSVLSNMYVSLNSCSYQILICLLNYSLTNNSALFIFDINNFITKFFVISYNQAISWMSFWAIQILSSTKSNFAIYSPTYILTAAGKFYCTCLLTK